MIVAAITTVSGTHGLRGAAIDGCTSWSALIAGPGRRPRHGRAEVGDEVEATVDLGMRIERRLLQAALAGRAQRGDRAPGEQPRQRCGRVDGQRARGVVGDDLAEHVGVLQVVGAQRDGAADQCQPAPVVVGIAGERLGQVVHGGAQRLEERLVVRATGEHRGEAAPTVGRIEEEHLLLRREVPVERARRDVHRVGDVLDGGALHATLAEQGQRCSEQHVARLQLLALPATEVGLDDALLTHTRESSNLSVSASCRTRSRRSPYAAAAWVSSTVPRSCPARPS